MNIFKGIKKAHEDQDMEALLSLYHEDCEFIRHKNGTSGTKAEFMERISRFWLAPSFDERMQRCIYEKDRRMPWQNFLSSDLPRSSIYCSQ